MKGRSLFIDDLKDCLLVHAVLMAKHALSLSLPLGPALSLSLRLGPAHMFFEALRLFLEFVSLQLLHQTANCVVVLVHVFIDYASRLPLWRHGFVGPWVLVGRGNG